MANVRKETVWVVDTTGQLSAGVMRVCGVKLVGSSSTLTLKCDGSGGTTLYSIATGSAAEVFDQVEFKSASGLYATITGSGTAYIYLEE